MYTLFDDSEFRKGLVVQIYIHSDIECTCTVNTLKRGNLNSVNFDDLVFLQCTASSQNILGRKMEI